MDTFARALLVAYELLGDSRFQQLRSERYSSFEGEAARRFEMGELILEDLREIALEGEPRQTSGRTELYRSINRIR